MLENSAFPVVFFLLSGFVFGLVLLFALARAWASALDPGNFKRDRFSRKSSASNDNRPDGSLAATRLDHTRD